MDATDFIISRLKELSSEFKSISIKYAFDKTTEFHIIEITPEKIRRECDKYVEWEINMWNEFYKNFPEDDILISEPSSLNNMCNVLYEKTTIASYNNDVCEHSYISDFHTYDKSFCYEIKENSYISALEPFNFAV